MTGRLPGLVVLFGLTAAVPLMAADPYQTVLGTPHDFVVRGDLPAGQRVCASCHGHDRMGAVDPLASGSGTDPVAQTSPPAAPPPLWQPSAPSFLIGSGHQAGKNLPTGSSGVCLECHDGVLGREVHQLDRGNARSFDHPYNTPYPRRADGRFLPERPTLNQYRYWSIPDLRDGRLVLPSGPVSTRLVLAGADSSTEGGAIPNLVRTGDGIMHCDSCHDPHSNGNGPFLRAPAHDLCLICHDR